MMYEQYKNINLPWLNEIPYHWDIHRNKNIFTEMKEEVGTDSEQYRLLSLTLNGIIPRDMDGGGKFPGSFDTYKIVKPGYMAFCLFDVDETPRTVGLSDYDGMLTGAYTIMKVHDVNARYVYYYYLALDNQKMLRPLYTGLRKTINVNTFQSLKIPIPPRTEQDQIVRFLDWKVSMINRLIHINRKRLAYLDELRKSIISHAVTRGLNETKQKPTGIYWLSTVPYTWKETKLKHILRKHQRPVPQNADLLICSNSGEVKIRGDEKIGLVAMSSDIYQGVAKGDLLIHGMDTWHGAIAISNFDGMCTPVVHVCSCSQSKRFVAYYLKMMAYTKVFKAISNGVRQNTSDFRSWNKVGELLIAFPDTNTQEIISDFVDAKLNKIATLKGKAKNKIDVLVELKNRIIADATTGKIDVRNIEIPEYEFVGEESQTEEEFDAEGSDNGE